MVEAENAKQTEPEDHTKQEPKDPERGKELKEEVVPKTEVVDAAAPTMQKEEASSAGKKRGREEVEADGNLPEAKRVDSKVEQGEGKESMES
jgi:hypothetical protein